MDFLSKVLTPLRIRWTIPLSELYFSNLIDGEGVLQLHVYAHGPCLDFLRLSGVKETVLQAPVSNIGDD
jgi:hypothetical protein